MPTSNTNLDPKKIIPNDNNSIVERALIRIPPKYSIDRLLARIAAKEKLMNITDDPINAVITIVGFTDIAMSIKGPVPCPTI